MRTTSVPHVLNRRVLLLAASVLLAVALLLSTVNVAPATGQATPPAVPWIDVFGPTGAPDRVVMTPTADVTTSQAVTWRTTTSVSTPVGQIVPLEGGPGFKNYDGRSGRNEVVTVAGRTTGDVDETLHYPMRFHTVEFTGLQPGASYLYRVGDGSNHRANWSEWFEFTTPTAEDSDFTFLYYGDAQNSIKEHASRVFRKAFAQAPHTEVVVNAGDLIDIGNRDYEWGEWFHANGFIPGHVNMVSSPGNHEYSIQQGTPGLASYWDTQFNHPDNGPKAPEGTPFPAVYAALDRGNVWYADYKGVRFISLDSNGSAVPSGAQRQAWFDIQAAWADEVLAANPGKWSVITFHHPVFSVSTGRDNPQLRNAWLPVFERNNVDLVLQGHDHTYGRGNLVNARIGETAKHGGTVYAVSVSGPKMYDVSGTVWGNNGAELRSTAQDTQLYQIIDVTGDEIRYEAFTGAGEFHDGFLIRKTDAGEKVVRDLPLVSEVADLRAELAELIDAEGILPSLAEKIRHAFDQYEVMIANPRQRGPAISHLDRAARLLEWQADVVERGKPNQGDPAGLLALARSVRDHIASLG